VIGSEESLVETCAEVSKETGALWRGGAIAARVEARAARAHELDAESWRVASVRESLGERLLAQGDLSAAKQSFAQAVELYGEARSRALQARSVDAAASFTVRLTPVGAARATKKPPGLLATMLGVAAVVAIANGVSWWHEGGLSKSNLFAVSDARVTAAAPAGRGDASLLCVDPFAPAPDVHHTPLSPSASSESGSHFSSHVLADAASRPVIR
jgi:hypothetical protein